MQDSFETVNAGKACLPLAWRDEPPSNDKAKKLLAFFKNDFFTCVNEPPCNACGSKEKMKCVGMRGPQTREEFAGMASRVEIYACESCGGLQTFFPRFNNPITLMSWRKGRCGEWANCFCALAVAAGFQVRFILDLTDHVWGEILSPEEQRWIHCDPCENAFDAPLMYESGWNKKLSWVFAFETGGFVKDVTRRYSRKWDNEMLLRRIDCHSLFLTRLLQSRAPMYTFPSEQAEFDKCIQNTLPIQRKRKERKTKQQEQQMTEGGDRPLKPEELRGRISGSESWRRARGELGDDKKEFQARYRELVANGKTPNEAAVLALQQMMADRREGQDRTKLDEKLKEKDDTR